MGPRRLFLVPGFLGFANLGDLSYWGHVHRFLAERGLGEGVVVPSPPSGSLRQRARVLAETVLQHSAPGEDVALVCHSSGGLDARLLLSPGASFAPELDVEALGRRTRAVLTVATPHLGTPVAAAFSSVQGRRLLRAVSAATALVIRRGSIPLSAALRLGELLVRTVPDEGVVEELYTSLLGEFSAERRQDVARFLADVGSDQALLEQLRPEAMDALAAVLSDRPGVRYGCVATRSRPPRLGTAVRSALSPYRQATYAWYMATWTLASRFETPAGHPLSQSQAGALDAHHPPLRPGDSDGMVPTLSQVHGEVVASANADHLDVIGHFHGPGLAPPHRDWIRTGTGFDRARFEVVWGRVADWLRA